MVSMAGVWQWTEPQLLWRPWAQVSSVCVCVIQRDLVALVLLLAGGRLAMVEAGGGRRGKFNIVSSKWGDGWRGGDWLCEFYTNRNGQYAFWTKCTYTTLSGDLPDCFEWVAPRTLRSLSSSGWSFLSFREAQSSDEHLFYNFIKEQASYKCKKCDRQGSAYSLRTWWWRRLNRVFLAYCGCNSSLLLYFFIAYSLLSLKLLLSNLHPSRSGSCHTHNSWLNLDFNSPEHVWYRQSVSYCFEKRRR